MRVEGIRSVARTGRGASLLLAGAAVVLCVFLPSGRSASGQDFSVCTADVKQYCKRVRPGDGRVDACLKKNEAKLSDPCKKVIATVEEQVKEVNQACADDLHMFCSKVQPGGGRTATCLSDHAKQLSRACKVKLMKGE